MCVCTRRGLSPPLAQRRRLRGKKDLAELCASRSVWVELLCYMDDLIFTHVTPREGTRLCADEDACQHSRCDDSSGPAGSWEWKVLLQGVAEASLQAPSWSKGIAPGLASLVGTVVRQDLRPLSGRELADSSVAPIKSSPSMVEDQKMVSVGGSAAPQAPAPARTICSVV